MSYSITWEEAGVIWRYEGTLSGEELIQSNLDIYGDSRFDQLRHQIVDLRGVTEFEISPQHMRKIAFLDKAAAQSNPHIRIAVITEDPIGQRITEEYASHIGDAHWPVRTFEQYDKAIDWARGYSHQAKRS